MGSRAVSMEPWNRLSLPRPAIQCQVTLPLSRDTGEHLQVLVERCLTVQSLLGSNELNTDASTLDSILYVYHHRLCHHKHYLSLKQVQQCIRRLRLIGLKDSLQEIIDLCPKEAELTSAESCSVPSQPIMELVSMKILGACKLMVRLMDCCLKAFHVCLQQLHIKDFIVLSVVLLGLLSRLWVLIRGVLKNLVPLYSAQICVQQEVSAYQKMPYFKDFSFPASIEDHLGVMFEDLAKNKLPKMFSKKDTLESSTQMLNKLFQTSSLIQEERESPSMKECLEPGVTSVDLGQKVQRLRRDKLVKFDVKSFFHSEEAWSSKPKKEQNTLHQNKRTCMKHMIPQIQRSSSFKELSEQLLSFVTWCRKRKLKSEAMFFRYKHLRCNRLQYMEDLGYSLKNKLQSWKKSICHTLQEGKLQTDYLKTYLRIQRCHQSWNRKVTFSRRHKLHKCHIAHSKSPLKRTPLKSLCSELLSGDQEVSPVAKDTVLRQKTSKPSVSSANIEIADGRLAEDIDIDDIFSSIGL